MGGFTPVASLLMPAIGEIIGITDSSGQRSAQKRAQTQSLEHLRQQQANSQRAAEENAAIERERIAIQAEQTERERRAALKRATARQRARFGSSGIDTNSSSSAQAVLLGLFDESDAERAEREALDGLRNRALDSDLAQRQRLNVLQQTQLRERQKLENASSSRSFAGSLVNSATSLF